MCWSDASWSLRREGNKGGFMTALYLWKKRGMDRALVLSIIYIRPHLSPRGDTSNTENALPIGSMVPTPTCVFRESTFHPISLATLCTVVMWWCVICKRWGTSVLQTTRSLRLLLSIYQQQLNYLLCLLRLFYLVLHCFIVAPSAISVIFLGSYAVFS